MINELGYPRGGIAIEMPLVQLPHLQGKDLIIPDRRADIIFFVPTETKEAMRPLLMIECKAVPLTEKVLQQVSGYNHYVGARFIAVANADEIRMGWRHKENGDYQFLPFIPLYEELLAHVIHK
mgnify:CR=1 FL=1